VFIETHFWHLFWSRRIKFRVSRCFFYTHFNIIIPSMLTHPKCRLISFTINLFCFLFLPCVLYSIPISPSCEQAVSRPVWHIPLQCVQWKTPDNGQRNSPKHVEFYSKNKFEKLLHLVGFIIRIYHDARSSERQKTLSCISMKCHTLTFLASTVQRRRKCLFADTLSNSNPFQNKIWRHCLKIYLVWSTENVKQNNNTVNAK